MNQWYWTSLTHLEESSPRVRWIVGAYGSEYEMTWVVEPLKEWSWLTNYYGVRVFNTKKGAITFIDDLTHTTSFNRGDLNMRDIFIERVEANEAYCPSKNKRYLYEDIRNGHKTRHHYKTILSKENNYDKEFGLIVEMYSKDGIRREKITDLKMYSSKFSEEPTNTFFNGLHKRLANLNSKKERNNMVDQDENGIHRSYECNCGLHNLGLTAYVNSKAETQDIVDVEMAQLDKVYRSRDTYNTDLAWMSAVFGMVEILEDRLKELKALEYNKDITDTPYKEVAGYTRLADKVYLKNDNLNIDKLSISTSSNGNQFISLKKEHTDYSKNGKSYLAHDDTELTDKLNEVIDIANSRDKYNDDLEWVDNIIATAEEVHKTLLAEYREAVPVTKGDNELCPTGW